MFQKEWEVLVVDDDPDVLAVSRLALRSVKVCARPGIAAACLVSTPTFRVPDFVPEVVYYSICSHAANWNSSS